MLWDHSINSWYYFPTISVCDYNPSTLQTVGWTDKRTDDTR